MASLPHVQEIAARYRSQGVVVLASCTRDARDKFEAWVRKNQQKYPDIVFAHDAVALKSERVSLKLYGVSGIPAQYVIGRDGRIVDAILGYMKGEALLERGLARAGVKVDPAVLARAAEDAKRRAVLENRPAPAPPSDPRKN
ncbi:MAG: TlpA disulfide reductase family protein [Opitutaceae bacterium]|nr:TlpA disulfide reductase family protein [Opitutaceae bacterium]